jgi:DNA-directed RNA polymerase subunit RPC12/RpoP
MNQEIVCPHCSNSDERMLELEVVSNKLEVWYCGVCSKLFSLVKEKNENTTQNTRNSS